MALKRKLSQEFDDAAYVAVRPTAKKVQTAFVYSTEAFPLSDSDMDVDMSDSSSGAELSPLNIPDHPFHSRLASNASSTGSYLESPNTSPSYPAFDLYPHNPDTMSIDNADYFNFAAESSPRMVGLMQPKAFTHHRFQNFVSLAPPDPTTDGPCGLTAKNVARSKWWTRTSRPNQQNPTRNVMFDIVSYLATPTSATISAIDLRLRHSTFNCIKPRHCLCSQYCSQPFYTTFPHHLGNKLLTINLVNCIQHLLLPSTN
ncbi:hypothetical protein EIP91_002446 [Steccherinum ochraceum]|uniref:Uncharacterized protein n=1 Tax=Steccherinum ochraceum TaxID=92696 RepID=A0A4R0RKM4_9APHY|nr:hypothetical protein EIP91_002446 [Steccherinum ochraceum]